jgi:hypothetical protein
MLPGRYTRVRSQIWQRVTGTWVTVTGKRRERGVLITFHDASPGVTLPSVLARTRDSRLHERAFRGHDGLRKYPEHARYRAVDAHNGRNAGNVMNRPNKRAPTRRSVRRLEGDGLAGAARR